MKRISFFTLPVILFVLFLAGCSDRMAKEGDLSMGPDLAGSSSSEESNVETLVLESEDWDGVSPLENGRFYRIKGIEAIRKALADRPEELKMVEQQLAKAAPRIEYLEKQNTLLSREISRTEVFEKARRLLADMPEVLKQVESLLNDVSFPYKPIRKDPGSQPSRKLKVGIKRSQSGLVPKGEPIGKKKSTISEPTLASEWGDVVAYCKQETTWGTDGWTTYPSPIHMWVCTDGYMACQWAGTIKYPFYHEVTYEPEYTVLYYIPFDYEYNPGLEFGVDAGLYEMLNGVTMGVECGIRILNWETYNLIHLYHDEDSQTWSFIAKGDCELDGDRDINDLLQLLRWYNLTETPSPGNEQYAGDVDDNGTLDGNDVAALINLL